MIAPTVRNAPMSKWITCSEPERLLFWVSVAGAACMMWLTRRLPMTDLPQHAAQIALWRDLLTGNSRWSHLVYINLLTPYLIGYGLALPLSFLFSLETSVRIVLTLAFFGFIAGCVGLRKEIGSDKRLDWLFLPSFFGFDWKWGLLTFLAAAPVLFGFLIITLRYRRAPNLARGGALIGMGVVLFFSHGLTFLFGLFTAGLLLLGPIREAWKSRLSRLSPLFALSALLAVFALFTSDRGIAAHYDHWGMGDQIWIRPFDVLEFISGTNRGWDIVQADLAVVVMLMPFYIGVQFNSGAANVLMLAIGLILLALPSYAFQTALIFERFAIFLLPFYALQFRPSGKINPWSKVVFAARSTMVLACLTILMIQASRIWAFGKEGALFDRVEQAAAPGKRALYLVFDRNSKGASNKEAMDHFASWYQADKHGFVDFNFAEFPPQIVRFRPNDFPQVRRLFTFFPQAFDWQKDHAWIYRYFFIRGSASRVDWLKARSPCKLSLVAADAPWFLVRRDSCPAGSYTPS